MTWLQDKIAIVTGGAGGIGAAAAERFVAEGAKVTLFDLDEAKLRSIAERVGTDCVHCVAGDVSAERDVQRCVEQTASRFGGLDVMFANAGIEGKIGPLIYCEQEDFETVLHVNVLGAWLSAKHAAPAIRERGGGSIIITSSIAGLLGSKGLGPYVVSKHAVVGLVRTLALELAPFRIRVNSVNPGPIENRMMRSVEEQSEPGAPERVKRAFESGIALGRYGTNEEIANLALFLASDESSYCTGAVFVADGGFTVA